MKNVFFAYSYYYFYFFNERVRAIDAAKSAM
jgi:hypothetical protein